jgi:hypothetical protein
MMVSNVKKTHMATTALCFLLFALAVTSLALDVNFGVANPFMHLPMDPHTIVTILAPPTSSTFQTENVILRVSLNLSQWYMTYKGTTTMNGHISSVYYELDGQAMMYSGALSPSSGFSTCSAPLNGLSEGNHSLKVYVRTSGYYSRSYVADGGILGFTNVDGQVEDSSDLVYFTIATPPVIPPVISHLSLENKTYSSDQILLNFNVDVPVSQISYSLDNNSNVTIGGNATLSMPQGSHSIVVYSKDTNGITVKSDTIFFTVTNPTPIPSPSSTPSPAPSPTLQPTMEPSPIPTANNYLDWGPYAIVAVVVLIGLSVLIYFKKRKRS